VATVRYTVGTLYAPLARAGRLIAFHDIMAGAEAAVGEVPRLRREARSALRDPVDSVASSSQRTYRVGLGRWPVVGSEAPR
jgi:hypothetical protein